MKHRRHRYGRDLMPKSMMGKAGIALGAALGGAFLYANSRRFRAGDNAKLIDQRASGGFLMVRVVKDASLITGSFADGPVTVGPAVGLTDQATFAALFPGMASVDVGNWLLTK